MEMMMNTTIIWDFNGTLLDDTLFCVDSMNKVLNKRGLPSITLQKYREIFGFPVKGYYEKAGFDLNLFSFHELSGEFIKLYYEGVYTKTKLHESAREVLSYFHAQGIKQVILSAMEHEGLVALTKFFNIYDYFESVWGIDDHHASGKIQIAKNHMDEIKSQNLFYIGDTDHDEEVARFLHARLIFHCNGSQSIDRLAVFNDAILADNLKQVQDIIGKVSNGPVPQKN
ncbi:MAG: hypothetical protein A2381_02245 [Bdellovibrionales bacterium RIFOXYB1_FULL_37_110]|nr:MAG: hypothetical protein A2417_13550 [Bdellovibrionales bacterium RIFOXYC1_FULL_37_79]OFZ59259.1 MAG: hypothetical protein A2381_02245 [Bdellovibrionales bacterium RIFOXYB1_FULL_37_110]